MGHKPSLELETPLHGISPFGGAADGYRLNGYSPEYVAGFVAEYYRDGGTTTDFNGLLTFSRSGTAEYADINGDAQTAADGEPRVGAHYNDGGWTDGGILYQTSDGESLEITNLPAGTYDVRVIRRGRTYDFPGVVHAGGAYWPV